MAVAAEKRAVAEPGRTSPRTAVISRRTGPRP